MAIETPTQGVTCDTCGHYEEVELPFTYQNNSGDGSYDADAAETELESIGWALHFGDADEVKCESCAGEALSDEEGD